MAFRLRDVAVGPDGLHKARLDGDQLWFDNDPAVNLIAPCLGLRLAVNAMTGERAAVVVDARDVLQGGGMVYLVFADRTVEAVAVCTGAYAAAIRAVGDGFEIYLQRPGVNGLDVYHDNGLWSRLVPVEYSAMGILRILPDGTPLMANAPDANVTVMGVTLYGVDTMDGYWLGCADCGDSDKGGAVLIKPDGAKLMWQGYQPLPPRLAVKDGVVWAALNGIDTPEPDAVPFEPYRPYVAPPAPKPSFPLPALTNLAPCWTGGVIERKGQTTIPFGNCSWSDAPQYPRSFPVTEMLDVSPEWGTGGRPFLHGLLDTEDSDLTDAEIDQQIAATKREKAYACYIHEDSTDQRDKTDRCVARVSAAGLLPIPGIHVIGSAVIDVRGLAVHGFTVNLRDVNWPDPNLRRVACAKVLGTLASNPAFTKPQVIYWFGFDACSDEELKTWLVQTLAAVPTPTRKPGEPEPVIVPPPDPPVVVIPGHGHNADPPVVKKKPKRGTLG